MYRESCTWQIRVAELSVTGPLLKFMVLKKRCEYDSLMLTPSVYSTIDRNSYDFMWH